jgi:hypothetical protein
MIVQVMIPRLTKGLNNNAVGYVLIVFSFVMASGYIFTWAWIPDLQDVRPLRSYELPNKTLEELAKGKRGAMEGGQVIGFRAKLRRLWSPATHIIHT